MAPTWLGLGLMLLLLAWVVFMLWAVFSPSEAAERLARRVAPPPQPAPEHEEERPRSRREMLLLLLFSTTLYLGLLLWAPAPKVEVFEVFGFAMVIGLGLTGGAPWPFRLGALVMVGLSFAAGVGAAPRLAPALKEGLAYVMLAVSILAATPLEQPWRARDLPWWLGKLILVAAGLFISWVFELMHLGLYLVAAAYLPPIIRWIWRKLHPQDVTGPAANGSGR